MFCLQIAMAKVNNSKREVGLLSLEVFYHPLSIFVKPIKQYVHTLLLFKINS